MKFTIFLKSSLLFNSFYCLFLFINKILSLNGLKTRTAMKFQRLLSALKRSYQGVTGPEPAHVLFQNFRVHPMM